ncbi:MAG: ATP-dependent nuclease [Paracoccus sp. (in: a-proteobacteria)]|uniref:ATP-dependent nuclease n=1 Tax=Paracoccus sp. TaxID=267 RepID=UPI00391B0781
MISDDLSKSIDSPHVWVSSLTFSSGQKFEFSPNEKVLIVGANNSGKSQSLRDIRDHLSSVNPKARLVATNASFGFSCSREDFAEYFLRNSIEFGSDHVVFNSTGLQAGAYNGWQAGGRLSGGLSAAFLSVLDAMSRLGGVGPVSHSEGEQPHSHPLQFMYDSQAMLTEVNEIMKASFGKELLFDYRSGGLIIAYLGSRPDEALFPNQASDEYVKIVRDNPRLDKQGDGIKSFAGTVLKAMSVPRSITLIDEPEAFLHPPQKKLLGELLGDKISGQIFVATHSGDFVRGFLEGTQGAVRILRVIRDGNLNSIHEASTASISSLWKTPSLKYSNAIDAIFHDQAIICEDHSDCLLYNSASKHIQKNRVSHGDDISFIPSGGKDSVPKVAKTLREVGVPVKTILDIDALSDWTFLSKLLIAFGADPEQAKVHWSRVNSELKSKHKTKSEAEMYDDLLSYVVSVSSVEFRANRAASLVKSRSAWAALKEHGASGLPKGDVRRYFESLIEYLQEYGIFIVPVGEIEGFCPEVGGHGPKFVTSVLNDYSFDDEKLKGLIDFVDLVVKADTQ